MALSDLTRESVLEAMREFDDIGREEFLKLYGFDEARGFTLVHDGRHYDSKAIAGVAHRHSVEEILKASSYSGGRSQTVPALIRLGFRIIDAGYTQQRAWLVASKHTYRRLAGGDTYDDHVATHYSWDSNVANSRQIRAGDLVAVWDESELLGASVIESIELSRGPKSIGRCPECAKVNIAWRVTMKPVFRCDDCKHTFDVPTVTESIVDKFKSTHGQGWVDLAGTLGRDELLELCGRVFAEQCP